MSMTPGLDLNQVGKTRPLNVEKPRMRRLRDELRSTYCRERERERACDKEKREMQIFLNCLLTLEMLTNTWDEVLR